MQFQMHSQSANPPDLSLESFLADVSQGRNVAALTGKYSKPDLMRFAAAYNINKRTIVKKAELLDLLLVAVKLGNAALPANGAPVPASLGLDVPVALAAPPVAPAMAAPHASALDGGRVAAALAAPPIAPLVLPPEAPRAAAVDGGGGAAAAVHHPIAPGPAPVVAAPHAAAVELPFANRARPNGRPVTMQTLADELYILRAYMQVVQPPMPVTNIGKQTAAAVRLHYDEVLAKLSTKLTSASPAVSLDLIGSFRASLKSAIIARFIALVLLDDRLRGLFIKLMTELRSRAEIDARQTGSSHPIWTEIMTAFNDETMNALLLQIISCIHNVLVCISCRWKPISRIGGYVGTSCITSESSSIFISCCVLIIIISSSCSSATCGW